MSTVLVKITAEVIDPSRDVTLGRFQVVDTTDLETGDDIARAVDFILGADIARTWEQVD